jgi:hypothetical protein
MQANLVNGWREVLERIFAGFEAQHSITPDWLVNPETGRHLKLDYLYPEIGVAVRFVGLDGGGRKRRKSDEEVAADSAREDSRAAVCRGHGVVLVSIDPDGEPREALRRIEMGLARATAQMAMGKAPQARKQRLMPMLSHARQRTGEFTTRLPNPDSLLTYAELWWDRQAALVANPGPVRSAQIPAFRYTAGMAVIHDKFGAGRVTAVEPDGDDLAVTVDFPEAGLRTFAASVVGSKLRPLTGS